MLNRLAVTTVTAAALGALVATALMTPAPRERITEYTRLAGTTETSATALLATPPMPDAALSDESIAPPAAPEEGAATAMETPAVVAEMVAEPEPPADAIERRTAALGRGGTLIQLLLDAEVPRDSAHQAISAMRKVHNPRQLRQGQEFAVLFDRTGEAPQFVGFEFQPAVDRIVSVSAAADGFTATEVEKPLTRMTMGARATIDSSLYQAAADAGVPVPVIVGLIRTYSYDVDFQRDIKAGDGFEVLFDRYATEDGAIAREGDVRYAALTLGGKTLPIYRFELPDGTVDYFNRKGESVRKALLVTPIDGARISSGFGMRRHPVLGYSKMHKGMDFAAPTGTPIYAAGDGVIEEAGAKGSYGNYVRIRHNGKLQTAYAHMSRFGKNIRRGSRVSQGDVIGYVGSTGRSTGPHLHYEVLQNGRQVNPSKAVMPAGRTLAGQELKAFQAVVAKVDAEFAARMQVAEAGGRDGGVEAASEAASLTLVSSPGNAATRCKAASAC